MVVMAVDTDMERGLLRLRLDMVDMAAVMVDMVVIAVDTDMAVNCYYILCYISPLTKIIIWPQDKKHK
jgi:hypothetical protein